MIPNFARAVIAWALKKQGLPYIWGGKGLLSWGPLMSEPTAKNHGCDEGFDCIGLFTAACHAVGGPDLRFDWSCQEAFINLAQPTLGEMGRLKLYGPDVKLVQHIAVELSPWHQLEAAGGDHTTTNYMQAIKRGAKVAVRDAQEGRRDLLGYRSLESMQFFVPAKGRP